MSEASKITEEQQVNQSFKELLDLCPRCQTAEGKKLVHKAFDLAFEAHRDVRRKSGELYILHPLAVARIVADEIGLGSKGVAAALLHDVVEDTDYTLEDIEGIFGGKVADIVDGLTKLEGVFDQTKSKQAENFRKLLLTMVEDIRVILIKLADRLHNMRTLDSMPEHKRLKIAGETLYLYAPLAHRLGLYSIKSELEDLSLKYEHPKVFNEITSKLTEYQNKTQHLITRFSLPIIERLSSEGYEFDIKGRPKSIYSIWRKMQRKQVPFEEIYDLLAIRIVFKPKQGIPEKAQCWTIYSLITDIYRPKPDRLRDWVSTPKANGYEALHATVMGPEGNWIEIQIRTDRMDEIAEKGFAAHWKYKGSNEKESELDNWLQQIRDVLDNPDSDSLEFLDDFKLNLFSQEIMIFTPKGDVKVMPKGATALDLAFEIHTELGYKCIGAKVNYKLVPLSYELKSGDQVEILTSEKQTPKYDWITFVTTAKAKTRIKDAFKKERKAIIQRGEQKLEEALNETKLTTNSKILKKLQKHYNLPTKEELYFKIGKNVINLENLNKILSDKTENKWIRYWRLSFGKGSEKVFGKKKIGKDSKKTQMVVSDDMDAEQYIIAPCCNPIPGDDVVGYLDQDDKLILHSRKCPVAIRLMSSQGNRIVSAEWESHKILSFLAVINLSGIDQIGIVSKITKVISDDQTVNMRSIHVESHDGIFEGTIYLYIHNTEDLNNLIFNLVKIKGLHNVTRQERIHSNS
ncbi:RelA/SpoT family protein [Marinilabilia rubra]|uniref:GTP pyrophosphokinase n=1 Tax=Marinilabilia rubra TaxID=2162893 RepID=A0A2U2B9P0_9BACT|nr:bifunctional (p)ppGpp synthetase/guanosine-3',5'-bis(diphosphate) 3'-pyrophosphohydrolase [Marinilabilia rubra]PWD99789.1 GTP pyrophosphokinase [Marinilabilia rubra]